MGLKESLVTLGLALSAMDGVTITMTGPANGNWFGVGFNTHVMAGSPYAIIIDGAGKVTEHVLADQGGAPTRAVLNTSVAVLSHTVADGKRTLVMTRPLAGLSLQHHNFDPRKLSLDFISALGATPALGYHKSKTIGTIALWPKTPSPTKGGVSSFFRSNPADGTEMRNDWVGEVGYQIVPKQAVTVTALGRAAPGQAALKAGAAVNIWSVKTKKTVATVVVGPEAGAPEQGYAFVDLAAPVVLQAGQAYYVTQSCTKGMPDKFTNTATNAHAANQQLVTLGHGVYSSPAGFPTQAEKGPQFAGVATFKMEVPPNLHPAPAAACVCSVPAAEFGKGSGEITYVDPLGKATRCAALPFLVCSLPVLVCVDCVFSLAFHSTIGFPPRCEPYPRETVLRDQNPVRSKSISVYIELEQCLTIPGIAPSRPAPRPCRQPRKPGWRQLPPQPFQSHLRVTSPGFFRRPAISVRT